MHSKEELRGIERFFHEKIPLVRAMGVRVEGYDGRSLSLSAPLERNHNHLGTAFGGSLAALAGYGLLWLELGEAADAHVVIARSSMRYLRPVRGAIHAVGVRPAEGRVAVEFEGRFVALRGKKE